VKAPHGEPLPDWAKVLSIRVDSALLNLNRVLGVVRTRRKEYRGMPIGGIYRKFRTLLYSGNQAGAEAHAGIIYRLVQDLGLISRRSSLMLEFFKRRLKKEPMAKYRGTRFEICTAALLIENDLDIALADHSHLDTPDFLIAGRSGISKVECSAPQLETLKSEKDLFFKIESKLREKADKTYAGLDTVVVLDITALIYAEGRTPLLSQDLKTRISQIVEEVNLGCAILFFYSSHPHQPAELARRYDRCENPRMTASLREALEKGYPMINLSSAPVDIAHYA
jgi:hypothetical protein